MGRGDVELVRQVRQGRGQGEQLAADAVRRRLVAGIDERDAGGDRAAEPGVQLAELRAPGEDPLDVPGEGLELAGSRALFGHQHADSRRQGLQLQLADGPLDALRVGRLGREEDDDPVGVPGDEVDQVVRADDGGTEQEGLVQVGLHPLAEAVVGTDEEQPAGK